MTERSLTSDLIERIREYQQAHPELLESHHFVFDVPLGGRAWKKRKPDYIWLGVNPGASDPDDWDRWPENTKETRDFDWQNECGRSRGSKRRMTSLRKFLECLGENAYDSTTFSELFFWQAADTGKAFEKKYGHKFDAHPHWDFCNKINRALIERFEPKAVLAEGRKWLPQYEKSLGLRKPPPPKKAAYFDKYTDKNGEHSRESLLVRQFDSGIPFYCFDSLAARHPAQQLRPKVMKRIARLQAV